MFINISITTRFHLQTRDLLRGIILKRFCHEAFKKPSVHEKTFWLLVRGCVQAGVQRAMATDLQAEETRKLYRVRRTILEMLRDRGYLVLPTKTDLELPLEEFAHKFDAAGRARESLTMLRQHRADRSNQIYVFFPKDEKIGVKPIREYCMRLETENVLRAIIVVQTGLTPIAKQAVAELQPRFHLELFQEAELLVNITKHQLVPKHEVLTAEQKKTLLRRYQLRETQLPRILQSDPVARYFGVTRGQVFKITRSSETAGRYVTYRLVV